MRVTALEYYFESPQEAFAYAKANGLTGQIRLNLKDGSVCGGAHLQSPKPLDDLRNPQVQNGKSLTAHP